jgi:hypothetical protein
MARPCHVAGCNGEVLPFLMRDGVCLNHFVEMAIERAELIRGSCLQSQPIDQETIDWLLGEARHVAQVLSASDSGCHDDQVLELLLCLANLQDYIKHHSVAVKAPN